MKLEISQSTFTNTFTKVYRGTPKLSVEKASPRKNLTICGFHEYCGTALDKISWDRSRQLKADSRIYSRYNAYQIFSGSTAQASNSSEIAEPLVEKFINPNIVPKAWIIDQGPNFISNVMHYIARKYKISIYKTIAYRPHSNGSIECFHHVLMEYLKQWSQKHH